ncbi:hypothetical protein GYMLUDRAFT_395251 [Collybiopsis luxurians FD-317 M1]|uniref:Uncharacterized protein n=1 Tax=Collybiopsis luxurians FD-317 M1 TaxID=944289 RepID=A0A0D0C134_9AGAR|nr:hypothetical protein GYMLUDRAFT_395251 [Collybiopsis luxurians FD-317 M1]
MTFKTHVRFVSISDNANPDILHVPAHWHENHDEIIAILEGKKGSREVEWRN